MTQYPEAILARELEICYANISLITDYDAGLEENPNVKAVSHEMVIKVFNENLDNLRKVLIDIIKEIPDERNCICSNALETARL